MRRILLVSLLAAAGIAALPAAASAASGTVFTAEESTPQGRLAVHVDVLRFRATKAGPVADGVATATLRSFGEAPTTVRKKVTLQVAKSSSCTILTLTLDTLDLTLLGLNVHLDRVELKVTGKRRGGVLGSLFCSLAGAKVKAGQAAVASRLNKEIKRTGRLRPIGFSVPVMAVVSQAAPTCSVLDLVLGPLNVNLLGLIVDLKRVHLTITADPAGGILGRLFCGLANTPAPA